MVVKGMGKTPSIPLSPKGESSLAPTDSYSFYEEKISRETKAFVQARPRHGIRFFVGVRRGGDG
jgi:hypothetical protein